LRRYAAAFLLAFVALCFTPASAAATPVVSLTFFEAQDANGWYVSNVTLVVQRTALLVDGLLVEPLLLLRPPRLPGHADAGKHQVLVHVQRGDALDHDIHRSSSQTRTGHAAKRSLLEKSLCCVLAATVRGA
jgi:hypothetical protein